MPTTTHPRPVVAADYAITVEDGFSLWTDDQGIDALFTAWASADPQNRAWKRTDDGIAATWRTEDGSLEVDTYGVDFEVGAWSLYGLPFTATSSHPERDRMIEHLRDRGLVGSSASASADWTVGAADTIAALTLSEGEDMGDVSRRITQQLTR